jgi:tetratricopeptide (TPR) repeat protein
MGFRTGWLLAGALAPLMLFGTGCRTPQPGTWWGVRHVREAFDGEDGAVERPTDQRAPAPSGGRAAQARATGDVPQDSEYARAVRLAYNEHRYEEARQIFRRVVERNPRNAEAHRWLADCHYNLMDLERAIESYETALNLDPNNYNALQGKGFAHLHRGHEFWRRGEQTGDPGLRQRAHDHYKESLYILRQCLDIRPEESEVMYGLAMAAEGASRLLYATAVDYRQNAERTDAELVRSRAIDIIEEGVGAADRRIASHQLDKGPRLLKAGLLLRKATLNQKFDDRQTAVQDLRRSIQVLETILGQIDPQDPDARQMLEQNRALLSQWQAGM